MIATKVIMITISMMILRMQRLGEEPAKVAGCDEPVVGVVEQQVLVVLLQPDVVKYPHLMMMMMMLMIVMIFLIMDALASKN